jgi:hypothetical protein
MADWSLDNQISKRLFKVDNDLSPFYRSVSCWSLIGIWVMDLYAGFRQYAHWQAAGQLFLQCLLLAAATAILGIFLYRRGRLVSYLTKEHPTEAALKAMKSLSAGTVQMAGTLLIVVFFVMYVWR